MEQRGGVEVGDAGADFVEVEEERAGRDEQAEGELDGATFSIRSSERRTRRRSR